MAFQQSDADLVAAVLGGEAGAFATLVARYRRTAIMHALMVLNDGTEAEDAAQDAFVQAYQQLGTCRDPSRFRAWLMTIVHRRALNQRRALDRRRAAALDEEHPTTAPSPPQVVARRELRRRLLTALRRLSPTHRDVVLLADLEQLSHSEIAQRLRISETTSRWYLSDARRRLRTLLSSDKP